MNETLTRVFQQDVGADAPVRIAVSRPDAVESEPHVLLNPYGIIGRSPNCDVRLKDSQVSFRHAYLQMIGGRLFCADLGSRSGTSWGDVPQRAGWLSADEDVSIGPYQVRLLENPVVDGGDRIAIPPDFDPLAIYEGELGEMPDVHLEFLNAADDVDLPLRRMLTFAGSARGCKLRFEGDRISRVHCSLMLTPSGLWVIDLLGKGGTKVNGSLIRSDRLNDGDLLKLGQFQMRVHYEGAGEKPFSGTVLPPETSVETSSSTDEELPKTPREAETIPHPSLELSTSQDELANPCGRLVDELVVNRLMTREEIDVVLAEFEGRIPSFDELSDRLVELQTISQWQADQLATENHGPMILENRYQLIERLGYGSMGNVFLAFDEALQSKVAIKIPHHSLLKNERLFKRFRRETLISANLVHAHIVRALNIGRGNQFVVLELVDGDDLRDLMDRQGPPDTMMAVDFLIQVAEAVGHAQSEGVVHRDIKPSNILISREGTAKLFDFGLAHLDDEARKKGVAGHDADLIPTRMGFAVGTVQYMSPEQARESDDVDVRSDIYSLGCTFFEMLTGSPPFEGENQHQILKQHAQTPFPPIEGLDPELAKILEQMLAKDVEQRIQNPQQLIAALRNWQNAALAEDDAETSAAETAEEARLAEHEERLLHFQQEREEWQLAIDAQRQDVERQRDEWRAEADREKEELHLRQTAFEQSQAELNEREQAWASKTTELEQRLEQTAGVEEQLQSQRKTLSSERAKLEEELESLKGTQEELRQSTAELEAAREANEERQGLLDFQQAELTERREAFEQSINDHDLATQEMARDRDGLQQTQQELAQQQQNLQEAENTLRKQHGELEQLKNQLESQREQQEQDLAAFQKSRAELSAKLATLAAGQNELQQADVNLAAQSAELAAASAQLETERTVLAEERAELDTRRTTFEAEMTALQANAEQLRVEKQLCEQQRDELEKSTSQVKEEFSRLESERQQLTEARTQLTADSSALSTRTNKLKAALAEWFDE
ncbi:Serine/threonine-protein kinase PknB [Symmachiella macrocystis]|uniref:Serine/threonine-protein kinase PknB n=1 Tax=Symmachiella macrocystis TaxID=2527985 RepID=A0A5C6BB23_9PLAN|nr:protein kinase [Symmachiella macrocystis]TWU09178.1 Serine/threonine-protein kinase PknB [Symmachiella macrocystis]